MPFWIQRCYGRRRSRDLIAQGMFGTTAGVAAMGRIFGTHYNTGGGAGGGGGGAGTGGAKGKAGAAAGGSGTQGGDGGEGGDEGGDGGGESDDDADDEDKPVISKREKAKIVAARDRAKAETKAIAERLGLATKWVPDPDRPGKKTLVVDGLDEAADAVAAAREAAEDAAGDKGKKKKDRQDNAHAQQVLQLTTAHQKREAGLTGVVAQLAKVAPLRAALAAEGAVDEFEGDGERAGQYGDLVKLLGDRVEVTLEWPDDDDDEAGDGLPKLVTTVLDEDGDPLIKNGKPVKVRQLVKEFLDARKHLRRANFRPGGGAGGNGGAAGNVKPGGAKGDRAAHAKTSAASMFSLMI